MNEYPTTMTVDAAEIERLRQRVTSLTDERDTINNRLGEYVRKLDAYKGQVREAIIDFTDDGTTPSRSQVNELLDSLQLEMMTQTWNVTWREQYVVTIERSGTVEAATEEDAVEMVEEDPDSVDSDDRISALVESEVQMGGFEVDDRDAIAYVTAEPQDD